MRTKTTSGYASTLATTIDENDEALSMSDFDREILTGFVEEATGYLPALRAGAAALRAGTADAPTLEEAHRCAHTIKGAAAMVGLPDLSHVAFHLEEAIEKLTHEPDTATPEVFAQIDAGVAGIEAILVGMTAPVELPAPDAPPVDLPPPPEPESAISAELVEVFRLEAEEHIRVLTTLLPEARTDPTDRDRWQDIRRAAHTLKGTAGLVGFDDVTRLAHRMEDLLDLYFDGSRTATGDEIDALLAAADVIAETVEDRADPAAIAAAHARLEVILGVQPAAEVAEPEVVEEAVPLRPAREAAESFVRVPISKLDEIAKLVGELVIARTALEQRVGEFARLLGEAKPAAARLNRVSGKLESGYEASALAGGNSGHAGGGDGFDSLEFDRYTEFHLLSRELAETTTDVRTVFGEFGHILGEIEGQISRQVRIASEVEDKLMRLRMVPLSTITAKLARAARTSAATANKKAEFTLDGERTGLDKTVLEAMADPLLHLVRNAVDHGLEPPEVRLALGKPAHGTITLRGKHEGSHVVLTLADDGRGIDFEVVRAAVARRGLALPEEAESLSPAELADFLFRPGFSTRDEVSELSGRGVGLDVVKSKVELLKGTVVVASVPGVGTTFTVRLPMTLAVVRALLVKAGAQTFAIPLEAVEQILRPGDGDTDRVGRDPVLRLAGGVCPLVPLARVLNIRQADEPASIRPPVVVLSAGGRRVALQIDKLVGGREVVIKALGRQLRQVAAVSGATLLGDGSVVLILNPAELTRAQAAPQSAQPRAAASRPRDIKTVLVVDDSPSVRRVLSMLLGGAGWQVTTAKDGVEALDVLQRGGVPDVVLTDVEMPRMDGYELLATIRAQAAVSHLPVAVLTSRGADKHRRKALDLGASAYVVKPYQDENLLEILRHLARPVRAGV